MKTYILSSPIAILMLLMLGVAIGLSTPEPAWARSDSLKGKWVNNAHIRIDGQSYFYAADHDLLAPDEQYYYPSSAKKVEDPGNIDHEDNCIDYIKDDSFESDESDFPEFGKDTTTKTATLVTREHKKGEEKNVCRNRKEKDVKFTDRTVEDANIEFRQIDDKTIEPVHNDAVTKPGNIDDNNGEYQFLGTYKIDSGYSEDNDGERYVNTREDEEGCKSGLIKKSKGDSKVDASFRYGANPLIGGVRCGSKEFEGLRVAPQDSEGSGGGGDDQNDSSAGDSEDSGGSGGNDSGGDGSGGSGSNEQSGQSGDGDGGTGSGDGSGFVGNCTEQSSFLTFPTWYRGIQCEESGSGAPVFSKMSDIWTVATNLLDILIQIGGLAAVGFIIYGGIRYILSQGEPEKLQGAKKIIANAIIGLILAITASTIVGFIAGSFS